MTVENKPGCRICAGLLRFRQLEQVERVGDNLAEDLHPNDDGPNAGWGSR